MPRRIINRPIWLPPGRGGWNKQPLDDTYLTCPVDGESLKTEFVRRRKTGFARKKKTELVRRKRTSSVVRRNGNDHQGTDAILVKSCKKIEKKVMKRLRAPLPEDVLPELVAQKTYLEKTIEKSEANAHHLVMDLQSAIERFEDDLCKLKYECEEHNELTRKFYGEMTEEARKSLGQTMMQHRDVTLKHASIYEEIENALRYLESGRETKNRRIAVLKSEIEELTANYHNSLHELTMKTENMRIEVAKKNMKRLDAVFVEDLRRIAGSKFLQNWSLAVEENDFLVDGIKNTAESIQTLQEEIREAENDLSLARIRNETRTIDAEKLIKCRKLPANRYCTTTRLN